MPASPDRQSVIEAVTGQPFAAFMDAQVLRPLGMRHSSLMWKDEFAALAVSGTTFLWPPRSGRFDSALAAASLYTTAEDCARFLSAFLANKPLAGLRQRLRILTNHDRGMPLAVPIAHAVLPGGHNAFRFGMVG